MLRSLLGEEGSFVGGERAVLLGLWESLWVSGLSMG